MKTSTEKIPCVWSLAVAIVIWLVIVLLVPSCGVPVPAIKVIGRYGDYQYSSKGGIVITPRIPGTIEIIREK